MANFTGTPDNYVFYLKAWTLVTSGDKVTANDFPIDGSLGEDAQMALALGTRDAKAASPVLADFATYQSSMAGLAVPSS